jgi:hypothetical protein
MHAEQTMTGRFAALHIDFLQLTLIGALGI